MSGGPDIKIKVANAAKDQSFFASDTWKTLLRNFVVVGLISALVWGFCSFLRFSVEWGASHLFERFEQNHHASVWIFLAVIVGAAVVRSVLSLFKSWKDAEGNGMDESIEYFHNTYSESEKALKTAYHHSGFMRAIRRVVMTVLTLGTGGSGGLEGPVVPIGEAIGSWFSKVFRVDSMMDVRVFEIAGISAAVCTLLNTPLAAAVFAAEVVYAEHIIYRSFLYSLIAAVVAFGLNNHILHLQLFYGIHAHAEMYKPFEYFEVIAVAVVCSAPAALGVRYVFDFLKHKVFSSVPVFFRAPVAALCVAAIALAVWYGLGINPEHVLGSGEGSMNDLLNAVGPHFLMVWWILFLLVIAKTVATGLTMMSGGSAGMLVPAMFMGGFTGAGMFYLLVSMGVPLGVTHPDLFIVSGIASALVAVVEIPLAAIVFVMETFGDSFGPPAIVAVAVCYFFAKRFKLYRTLKR